MSYSYHIYDRYFNDLGRCDAEGQDAILNDYPDAFYILCSDYATRKMSFRSIPACKGPYEVLPEHVESLKNDGGYLCVSGKLNLFLKRQDDGSFTKVGKKHKATRFILQELIDMGAEYRKQGIKCTAVLEHNSLEDNIFAHLVGLKDNDEFYGGDVAVRF